MTVDDIQDAKVGTSQVTAIYLGDTLIWPTAAYTYEITAALLYYSSGDILDAGVRGSYYSSNYAYVMGTVRVKRGDTVVETLYDQVLKPSVSNTSDFVVPNDGYTYHGEDIYAYNLGGNATSAVKTSFVTVTYKNSEPFSLTTQVRQEINEEHITVSTDWREGSPEITAMEVSGTRYVDLVITDYTPTSVIKICPAYGGSTAMSAYGAHQMANYSSTPSYEWVTYYYTYTSGYTYTSSSATGNTRWTDPVRVGNPWDVNDNITVDLPSWLHYNSTNRVLTFDSEGTTEYQNGRSYLVVAHNGSVTDSERVYQQYNVIEETTTAYDLYCHIVRSSAFPAAGGTFPVNYHARKTTTSTYTSGSPVSSTVGVECRVETTPENIASVSEITGPISGNGSFNLNIPASQGSQNNYYVYITAKEDISKSASDYKTQEAGSFPKGQIYPYVSPFPQIVSPTQTYPAGRIQIHWLWTSGTTPTPSYPLTATFTNLTLHWVFEGGTQEYHSGYQGQIEATFSGNDVNFYPVGKFPPMLEGSKGRCWFTADSVTNISATYPTDKTFEVPDSTPPPISP